MRSHQRAIAALKRGKDEIVPIKVTETYVDANMKKKTKEYVVDTDDLKETSPEALAKLKPAAGGTVTAATFQRQLALLSSW